MFFCQEELKRLRDGGDETARQLLDQDKLDETNLRKEQKANSKRRSEEKIERFQRKLQEKAKKQKTKDLANKYFPDSDNEQNCFKSIFYQVLVVIKMPIYTAINNILF